MNIRMSTVKYMSRLTRLPVRLNSSWSQHINFFIILSPHLRPNLTLRFLSVKSTTSSQINLNVSPLHESISPISPPRFHKFTTSAIPAGREHLNQRKVLPKELSKDVMVLSCESTAEGGVCDVFVVGTCHVSQESCFKVQAVISYLKPQVVFLELCSSRKAVLTRQSLKVPTMREMVERLKKKQNALGILLGWFLAKVATELDVFPGHEFRVAFEEAKKYGGKVKLGDRPVNITLRRAWDKMPLWHKTKVMCGFLFGAPYVHSLKDLNRMVMDYSDITVMIQEMSKTFPIMMEALVHERDQYMSSTLLTVASEHSSVVAVVGKAHLQGIKKYWQQPVDMKDLMQMPTQKPAVSAVKVIASLGVAAAGVAIISGMYLSSKK